MSSIRMRFLTYLRRRIILIIAALLDLNCLGGAKLGKAVWAIVKKLQESQAEERRVFVLWVCIMLFWNCMPQGRDHSNFGEGVGFVWIWVDWFAFVSGGKFPKGGNFADIVTSFLFFFNLKSCVQRSCWLSAHVLPCFFFRIYGFCSLFW